MYFSKASALLLTTFLQIITISAAPLSLPRGSSISTSYANLPKPIVSPYYVYFGNPETPKLADAYDSLGLRAATVAFASAPQGKCSLVADLDGLVDDVHAFIAKGGAVSLSFGGNLGDQSQEARQHIQQACSDTASLAKLIEGAMSQFNTHNVEFDIEDNTLVADTAAAARLAQALVQVKKDIPDTYVTYTLGSNVNGMPGQQNSYVQTAKKNSLTIDSLILMTMNMGGKDNIKDTQTAIAGGISQLSSIYGITTDEAKKKIGMLPSIGVDNSLLMVDLSGITTLSQFAKAQGLSTISYWNFNRDFPGDVGAKAQSLSTSSAPDQKTASQFFTTITSSLNGTANGVASQGVAGGVAGKLNPQAVTSKLEIPTTPPTTNTQQPGKKQALPPPSADAAPQGGSVAAS